jgi:hypothetical protein
MQIYEKENTFLSVAVKALVLEKHFAQKTCNVWSTYHATY